MKQTPEEIKYRLSDLGVQIGNIALEYITELEKETEELKYQFHNLAEMDYSHQDRIEELEKENAELKENNKFLSNLVKEKEQSGIKIQEDLLKEIAEAKGIIKDFLLWENSWHEKTESKYALLKRAEDFIKE